MKKLSALAVAAFACLCFIGVMSGEVFADGTEALGVPSIQIESGSGVVMAGVGLAQSSTGYEPITIAVPLESTIKQVLFYWEGSMDTKSDDPNTSRSIEINSFTITGDLIGGPYHPFTGDHWNGLAFRADITDLDLVVPGHNILTVGNANFSGVANGAGLLVIYEKASLPRAEISILDGEDFAYHSYDGLLNTTVPQTFKFAESLLDRIAKLNMFFTTVKGEVSGGLFRPTAIEIKNNMSPDVVWFDNELYSNSGEEWDTLVKDVNIPAGATSLTIQVYSLDRLHIEKNPASLSWITAALSMPSALCSIGDLIWIDDNKNGIQDSGESGIEGVTVNLYKCLTNCSTNNTFRTANTDSNGGYLFENLPQGNYCLKFIKPDGYDFSLQDQGADDALDSDADPVTGRNRMHNS